MNSIIVALMPQLALKHASRTLFMESLPAFFSSPTVSHGVLSALFLHFTVLISSFFSTCSLLC